MYNTKYILDTIVSKFFLYSFYIKNIFFSGRKHFFWNFGKRDSRRNKLELRIDISYTISFENTNRTFHREKRSRFETFPTFCFWQKPERFHTRRSHIVYDPSIIFHNQRITFIPWNYQFIALSRLINIIAKWISREL